MHIDRIRQLAEVFFRDRDAFAVDVIIPNSSNDLEIRARSVPFQYYGVLLVSPNQTEANLGAELENLREMMVMAVTHGKAPYRDGYPKDIT